MSKYSHIFFDLDHTLWDFDANSRETLKELYDEFDLENKLTARSKDDFVERYIMHNERMWDLYRQNKISKGRLRKARFEAVLQDFGLVDKRLAKVIGEEYLKACPQKTKLNDHALEIVRELSSNFELHILSNGFHETQLTKLSASGLAPYFKEVITSERASAKKPQVRMFTFAEKVTGAPKSESLMIGDHVDIDVVGAIQFGWDAVHFNEFDERHDYPSVKKLDELGPMILGKSSE